ncbi:MAG TPA: hypothetical protein VLL08_02655 [Kineosporiaceae bacterium]|nr:hypothetical protein [Kineosporiaceae bacterium]
MNSYTTASTFTQDRDGGHLDLATALGVTPAGPVQNPFFFSGFVDRPDIAAAGLLAVADIAASRYADAGLAARLASLDPVVTAGGDRLRFESFSACNSVYARFDLTREGLGSGDVGFGTTNIDINLPLRTALARINRSEALHLSVGSEGLRASSLSQTHVERRVSLPDRWIRGLAEVSTLSATLTPATSLSGQAITRFLGGLPRVAPPGPTLHLLPRGNSVQTSRLPIPGTFALPGTTRLRGCDRIARHASELTVHTGRLGSTAWVFTVPGGRFTVLLSPDPFRGFSGEGTLLTLLTNPDAARLGGRLLTALGWTPTVDPSALATATNCSPAEVAAGLAWLAASGRLGHDLAENSYFHRELPVDSEKVLRRNPRLVAARKLVDDGGVVEQAGGWLVSSSYGRWYAVADAQPLHCQCEWEREHAGTRGPCKHLLAVMILRASGIDGRPPVASAGQP